MYNEGISSASPFRLGANILDHEGRPHRLLASRWSDGQPHFHAIYGEHEAVIDIRELRVMRGSLPGRALALVVEWAVDHREALLEDWNLCRQLKPPKPIPPLE
jgi:hypothetical protein